MHADAQSRMAAQSGAAPTGRARNVRATPYRTRAAVRSEISSTPPITSAAPNHSRAPGSSPHTSTPSAIATTGAISR